MPESKFEFEIPQRYYTREELNNYILKMLNTPIHVCSTTKGNFTISLKNVISDIKIKNIIIMLVY
jgi:hypothetical protein